MGAGKLKIISDTTHLLNGKFAYPSQTLKPIVKYIENEDTGTLTIKQSSDKIRYKEHSPHLWHLQLNNKVTMNLDINFGAGKGEFYLSDLNVENLDLNLGAGDAYIDLSGNNSITKLDLNMDIGRTELDITNINHGFKGKIEGGVGQLYVKLPKETGIKIHTEKGIGDVDVKGLYKEGLNSTYKCNF